MESPNLIIRDEERHDVLRIKHLIAVCTTDLYLRLHDHDHLPLDINDFEGELIDVIDDNMPVLISETADILGRDNPMETPYHSEELWNQAITENTMDLYLTIKEGMPDQIDVLYGGERKVVLGVHPTRGLCIRKMDRLWPTT